MSKRILIRNSLSGAAVLVIQVIAAFIMSPIIVHGLGNRDYGIWELLVGLVGYLGLLELGVGPALVRYVADAWSRQDLEVLNRIFNTGIVTLGSAGIAGLLIFPLVSLWPELLPNLQPGEANKITPLLLVFGLNLAASLPRTALSAYLLGLQYYEFTNGLLIVITIIQSFAFYYVLEGGFSPPLIWMGWIVFISTVIQSLIMVLWIAVLDNKVKFSPSAYSFSTMKELLGYGLKSTLMMVSTGTLKKLVSFVIAYTAGVAYIVYFAIPNRLVEYAQSLGEALGRPLTPYFADLAGKGDMEGTRRRWIQTTRILQIVTFGAPLAAAGLGEPFIHLWMGHEYAEQGKLVLYILCAGMLFQGIASNSARLLLSLARHGSIAVFSAAFAPLCFILSFGLGSIWGVNGVAVAITFYAISLSLVELIYACRAIELRLSVYLRETLLHFVVPVLLTVCILIGLRWYKYATSYSELLLEGAIAGAAYVLSTWYMALNTEERSYIRAMLSKRWPTAFSRSS